MDYQFRVDVPRLVFFIGEEWVPTSDPVEVWERLMTELDGNLMVVKNAAKCFKQQFLSDYYISEVADFTDGEALLSHRRHRITMDEHTKLIRVEKDFIYSLILDGENFNLDYCMLKILYDPYRNEEVDARWNYTMNNMKSGSRSIILNSDLDMFIGHDSEMTDV